LRVGGRVLIYVWALEQQNSRRGWKEGDAQDVLVPWVSRCKKVKESKGPTGSEEAESNGKEQEERVYQRYYHLYRKSELEEDIASAGGIVVEGGYEKDNWWAIAIPKEK